MPKITEENFDDLKKQIKASIAHVQNEKISILDFEKLKFCKVVAWPYPVENNQKEDNQNKCNFIEFINQLFTTIASVKAIEYLNAEKKKLEICLGTTSGRDLTIFEDNNRNIIAEIFAVTDPASNSKLKDEILSLVDPKPEEKENWSEINKRYVFFILAKDSFAQLRDKVYNWSSYNPTSDKPNIIYKNDLKIENRQATWTCECKDKEIKIVCWSSKECLKNWMVGKTKGGIV